MSEIISSEDDISKLVSNFQAQSLKREIELLDEKLHILDKESQTKIGNLSAQLALEKETEIKLRNQLSTKDKAISELNEVDELNYYLKYVKDGLLNLNIKTLAK